jgi:hypothetical protein
MAGSYMAIAPGKLWEIPDMVKVLEEREASTEGGPDVEI